MAIKWISATKGVRYREHETNKHNKRPDRYYVLQYKHGGKVFNEPLGWASDGVTQAMCEAELAKLKENWRSGVGYQSLKEKREQNLEKQALAKEKKRKEEALTFEYLFNNGYIEHQQLKKRQKSLNTIKNEESILNFHILPFFHDMPLSKIDRAKIREFEHHLLTKQSERTKKQLSASTRIHILNLISQLFNYAIIELGRDELVNPIKNIEKPTKNNERERWLKPHEAKLLLDTLLERSKDTHDIAKLALFTGMRQGEILGLTWGDVDLEERKFFLRHTKNGKSRYVYMTRECVDVLLSRYKNQQQFEKVFQCNALSKTYERTVEQIGLNAEISDPRQKVCFHTLRHTFASWQVQSGKSLFEVAGLLGHSSDSMTQRYSHLCPDKQRKATQAIEGILDEPKQAKTIPFEKVKEG